MAFDYEKRIAKRLFDGLENGTVPMDQLRTLAEEADPALLHFAFAWLRERYKGGRTYSEGVLGRIVELCRISPTTARRARQGESDPIVAWFEESYEYGGMDRGAFIELIVDKLEG